MKGLKLLDYYNGSIAAQNKTFPWTKLSHHHVTLYTNKDVKLESTISLAKANILKLVVSSALDPSLMLDAFLNCPYSRGLWCGGDKLNYQVTIN